MKNTRRFLAVSLSILTLAFAPGLASYQAAAQVINGAAAGRAGGIPVVPGFGVNGTGMAPLSPAMTLSPNLTGGLSASALGAPVPTFSQAALAPSALIPSVAGVSAAALPSLPVSALAARALPAAALPSGPGAKSSVGALETTNAPVAARTQLALAGEQLSAASDSEKTGILDAFFTGARQIYGRLTGNNAASAQVTAAVNAPIAANTPALAPSAPVSASLPSARAAVPVPVALEGRGLQPGEKFLSAPAEAKPELAPSDPADEQMDKKAIGGLFAQRTISIVAFILTSIAYPLITIPAVGVAGYGALMALGPLAAIATGPLNGFIADKMSARNGLVLMAAMRAVSALALPAFAAFGVLNFWTLLLASIANGWLLSSLMITEGTYIRRLAGVKNVPMVNGLAMINYLSLQVVLGLILGVGKYIDQFDLMLPFYISAAVHVLLVIPIIWKTIPNIQPAASAVAKAAVNFAESMRAKGAAVKAFFAKYWKEAALVAASIGAYFIWHSALPISAALMFWISRTDGFKVVWNQKPLRWAMLLSALTASLVYPFQYLALPLMASTIGGVAGKGLILGQLLGAYFFGQLIANAGRLSAPTGATKMPDIKIPFTGKTLSFERLVQGGVLTLAAVWAGVSLFPGSLIAAAAAVAIGATLLFASSKLSESGWIRFLGVGLAAVLLPYAFWGSMPALFVSVLLLGLFAGPSVVVLSSYFQTNARKSNLGAAIGVNGSAFNAAVSFGYAMLSLIVSLFTPAMPGALGPVGLIFIAAGIFFFFAPKLLPGLPGSSFNKKPAK